jgi:predicted DNA-binding transcriptional regulator YafY
MKQVEVYERLALIINLSRSGPFSWEAVSRKIEELQSIKGMDKSFSIRTFQRDLNEIREMHGIDIRFNRRINRYEVNEEDSGPINMNLQESFDMIHAFQLSKGISEFVFFDSRKAKGTEHLFGLVHAIQNRLIVSFEYSKYWLWEKENRTIKPLALKEFKNRWYLLGLNERDEFRTFGLDRITDLTIGSRRFEDSHKVDMLSYHQDIFGISNDPEISVQKVILTFTEFKGRYIKSMPWHQSQQILVDDGNILTISLDVKINYELISEILSHGDEVRVDGPERLREMVKERAENIIISIIK